MSSSTVRDVTYDLLRSLGLTTVFGNPGSTEETFLQNFPEDFKYVLALQEASAVAMADAFAQTTGRPALVNLHSSAGMGNGMGNLVAAYHGNTPLIVTSGQQHREMLIGEPYLGNREATTFPKPWVKWAYEPARAEDVPDAFMRAYAVAVQPPAGPVHLSIPLDDWNRPLDGPAVVRGVSTTVAPDIQRLRQFADRMTASERPALILGPEVDRAGGWDAGVALAVKLNAAVYGAPLQDRVSFPMDHYLFQGSAGMSIKTISDRLKGHDLVVVVGGEVFRYYPYVAGVLLPEGTELVQITNNPATAGCARVGDSLLGDARLSLELLVDMVADGSKRARPQPRVRNRVLPEETSSPMTPDEAHAALSEVRPDHVVFVCESTSTMEQQAEWLPTVETNSFFQTASGGIGWAVPATVGVALADRDRGVRRPVVGIIGDGSFQYSVQALWTAAQEELPIVFVAMRNHEYSILKSFAELEKTPGVPGLDLPGIDIAAVARGFGCKAVDVTSPDELKNEFKSALEANTTTVIVATTRPQKAAL
ncbi:benzoylformate decarboxylase [Streptomyces sp. NPDC048663]|uniref:benzoylformate decarboxylase n=1 Tax=Streptomyces sp. NPDC048663 TaxID=3155638 RepID=UPI003436A648